jgi:cytoskeletal protein CcmA (bactofilin family)
MEGIAAAGWFGGGDFIEKEVRTMSDLWKPEIRQANPSTPFAGPATEHATIGRSIVIKGEVSGQEALFVDGTVEGAIRFPDHRVSVGRGSQVTADITAKDVVVMGSVKGNIHCSDLLDVRAESTIRGDIVTRRIRIDDGAVLRGSVEIQTALKNSPKEPEAAKVETAVSPAVTPVPVTAAAAAAASGAKRVAGSSVLLKPE